MGRLNRREDVLATCDELVHRCGETDQQSVLDLTARALIGKATTLRELNRQEEALVVFDKVACRFGASKKSSLLRWSAIALINKVGLLITSNRAAEALNACDDVVRRFGRNADPDLRAITERALLEKADIELGMEQYEAATETAGRALDQRRMESPESRLRGHLIRAKAVMADGNRSACEHDVEAVLALLSEIDSFPKESLDALVFFSDALGLERMCELIKSSPSASLLLPLTTALELELGLEPRVPREVEEVAEDIRRDLAKLGKS